MAEQPADVPGAALLAFSGWGTAVIALTSAGATLGPPALERVHALVAGTLFAVGTGALLWAYLVGIARSRHDVVTLSGLFFLGGGTAPRPVRRRFLALTAAEVAAVLVAAGVHPFTDAAFGVLAPMYALGLMALWGARHGSFEPRSTPPTG